MSFSYPASSSSSRCPRKASKNPGLALDLSREARKPIPEECSVTRGRLFINQSFSDTPALEPDWDNGDGAPDNEDDGDAQYVYIHADSPFYRSRPSTSHLSLSGFSFACDALAQEDPLFSNSPGALFVEGSECDTPLSAVDAHVVVVDSESTDDVDSGMNLEWNTIKVNCASLDQGKSITISLEGGTSVSHQYF